MTKLVLDVETTTTNKGNPFTRANKLVVVGVLDVVSNTTYHFWEDLTGLQELIDKADLVIGFNIKFDLHWIRRAGITWDFNLRIWDCQLAEFIIGNQTTPYPSLDGTALKYGIEGKLDVVKEEYWKKGIDTDQVPHTILIDYLDRDLVVTKNVYEQQERKLVGNQRKLFSLQCQDLLVLEEMEFNGIQFDVAKSLEFADKEDAKVTQIEAQLKKGYENIPINWDSKDHLSCYLYGGTITVEDRVPIGFYKTGAKAGQPRNKVVEYKYELPQLVKPLKGSELQKEGYYATNDPTLRSIKGTAKVTERINLILERAKSAKLSGTYFRGLPKLIAEMDWPDGKLHGQFNQCVAATSRLSSTKPNMQNFSEEMKELLITRYI